MGFDVDTELDVCVVYLGLLDKLWVSYFEEKCREYDENYGFGGEGRGPRRGAQWPVCACGQGRARSSCAPRCLVCAPRPVCVAGEC